jgi:hypothetical protein
MIDPLLMTTLSGPPTILRGFWHSEGTGHLPKGSIHLCPLFVSSVHPNTKPPGPMLTIPTFWFTVVNIAIGALVAWSLSNLWRMGCAALFRIFYKDQLAWEESQNMVLIVNCRSALDCILSSTEILFRRRKITSTPQRRRAKFTLVVAIIVAAFAVALNFALPVIVALVPTTDYGRIVPYDCGLLPRNSESEERLVIAKLNRWANAAFASVDGYGVSSDKEESESTHTAVSFPQVIPTMVNECSPEVSGVCSAEHSFTFSANYTLYREHFALNIDIPFSLQVLETCYRPIQATAALPNTDPDPVHPIGYFYGPVNTGEPGGIQNYTAKLYSEAVYSTGYTLTQISTLSNLGPDSPAVWTPNSTLLMGGDTTFLLYFIGAVYMTDTSSDPIFATQTDPAAVPDPSVPLYDSLNTAVPIICDSKYIVCLKKGDCSPLGGMVTVYSWFMGRLNMTGNDSHLLSELLDVGDLLITALASPPIHRASTGSTAILASETVTNGLQLVPQNVTALKELTRLVQTGMIMLSSYMQLSAVGYWNVSGGTTESLSPTQKNSICNKIISQSAKVITIPVIPYILLLLSLLVVSLLPFAMKLVPMERLATAYRNLLEAWTLHSPGQLHREVVERIRGTFEYVDTTADWPTVESAHLRPFISIQMNTRRFGTGAYSFLMLLSIVWLIQFFLTAVEEKDESSSPTASPQIAKSPSMAGSFTSRYFPRRHSRARDLKYSLSI